LILLHNSQRRAFEFVSHFECRFGKRVAQCPLSQPKVATGLYAIC